MRKILLAVAAGALIWAGPALAGRYIEEDDGESGPVSPIVTFLAGALVGAWIRDITKR